MKDLIRLLIPNERIKDVKKNKLKLSRDESHYLNRVMRVKIGQELFIVNGEGYLWRAIKREKEFIEFVSLDKPDLIQNRKKILLGLAISTPKSGFEDILKMSTEIGIDFIQPIYTEHQVKKLSNKINKYVRWNSIIKESVEQCERLWSPKILDGTDLYEWINSVIRKDIISISVTRNENTTSLKKWLNSQIFLNEKKYIVWNVIGPEGGWSKKELNFFKESQIQFVKLSENILKTPTAAICTSSIFNQWRNDAINLYNSFEE